jgi:hypothetical protein
MHQVGDIFVGYSKLIDAPSGWEAVGREKLIAY